MKPWAEFTREDYLRMIDRRWPFWAALERQAKRESVLVIDRTGVVHLDAWFKGERLNVAC